jgi:glutamate 5-kinase
MDADLLVLLTDIDGLYTADPRKNPDAKHVDVVEKLDEHIMEFGGGSGTSLGTGGMATKLQAAKIATEAGCDMVIASGEDPAVLYDVVEGKRVGTRFVGKGE